MKTILYKNAAQLPKKKKFPAKITLIRREQSDFNIFAFSQGLIFVFQIMDVQEQ
jgi:hypothetical protein